MATSFEDAFHALCQMLGDKPSAQVAKLGQPDQVVEFQTHHAVWFKPTRAQFSWQNGVVSALTAPTDSARIGARPQVAPDDYDYRGVRVGMTKDQVRAAWGNPTDESQYVWTYANKLPYITRDTGTYKADLGLGFDEGGSVISFMATLDGPPDEEFKRLMQRGAYCISNELYLEALRCASDAERILDGGGGGAYIGDEFLTPARIRERAERSIPATALPQRAVAGTKNVGIAIALAIVFGPLGMLYSTISGAIVMFIVNLLALLLTAGIGLVLTWPIGIAWAAVAAMSHNKRLVPEVR